MSYSVASLGTGFAGYFAKFLQIAALTVLTMATLTPWSVTAANFGYEQVIRRAESLGKTAYQDPKSDVPKFLQDLDYDQYRDIRFRPESSLWRGQGTPFEVQFFHPGFNFRRTVTINTIEGETTKAVGFHPSSFDYGQNNLGERLGQSKVVGYAGFRLHYPINTPNYKDEVAVFLGASYFRVIGKRQVYGLSARGLAIDTGEATGEEFPYFREFWLLKPGRTDKQMTVFALLDSPSATGAYRFVIQPGDSTQVDVSATLFLRKRVTKFGVAPLTSMFLYGENTTTDPRIQKMVDFRPEVHDSDGLLIAAAGGEWIWRPLMNPQRLTVNSFQFTSPRGFGLMQRDRVFDRYQDLEARYEMRPSAWITPLGEWGEGRIELIQIPSPEEKHDNVVAMWVPKESPVPGRPVRLEYSLRWLQNDPKLPPAGRVESTRIATMPGGKARRIVLDFIGGMLEGLGHDAAIEGVVTAGPGVRIAEQRVERNSVTRGWRLVFQVATMDKPFEMRAFLKRGPDVLTETWTYLTEP